MKQDSFVTSDEQEKSANTIRGNASQRQEVKQPPAHEIRESYKIKQEITKLEHQPIKHTVTQMHTVKGKR